MSNDIRIKKGLDIKLIGEADKTVEQAIISNYYTISPVDFHGVIPKLVAKEGTTVKAGETLFFDKSQESVMFASPVSGKVIEIQRGPKRRIDAIKIEADKSQVFADFGVFDLNSATAESLKAHLLASGCWPFVKQRPYDVVANPNKAPKAIFISGYASAPLAADLDFTLKGKEAELQAAVTALGKLTEGAVHISVGTSSSPLAGLSGATIHQVSGPHPSGNVGTLINKVNPVNKGEVVWTVSAQDLVIIGELLLTGKFNAERIVALVGSSVEKPRYFKTVIGSEISTLIYDKGVSKDGNDRVISGFGVKNGMTHAEFYLTKNGPVFGEMAVRPPGGYYMELIEYAYGFNPWKTYVELETGSTPKPLPVKAKKSACVFMIHPGAGIVDEISGLELLKELKEVEQFKCKVEPGSEVGERDSTSSEVGHVLMSADSRKILLEKLQIVEDQLVIKMKQ